MDHDQLVLIAMLPGINAAIEQLTQQRDLIMGRLGLTETKKRPPTIALDLPAPVPPTHGVPRKQPPPKVAPVCPVCGEVFQRAQGLASHMRQSHRTTLQGKKIAAFPKHPCEFCSHTPFKSRSGWVSHMRGNHPDKLPVKTGA